MWGWSFLLVFGVYVWALRRYGTAPALAIAAILSLVVPSWVVMGYQMRSGGYSLLGMPIDMRMAISAIGLCVCLTKPAKLLSLRLTLTDCALAALVLVHMISDWKNDGVSLATTIRPFGEWVIPYLAGRLALTELEDVRKVLPFAVLVCVALGLIATLESLSGFHLAESVYGTRPPDGISSHMSRWGLKRAFGPARHPIYLGALLLLLFPWTTYAFSRARRGIGPKWWRVSPFFCSAGILFTISRGPIIGLLAALYVTTATLKPRLRMAAAVVGGLAIVVGIWQSEAVIKGLQTWSGEAQRIRKPKIVVDEREVEYTGTMSRLYLFDVYGLAMRRAGLLGFGTERVTGFPIRVPVGPEQAETLKRVRYIDNVYILLLLRFGYLGLACFVGFGLSAVWNFLALCQRQQQGVVFYASMSGAIAATMLVLVTVWMPHDFGFVFLFACGSSAGLSGGRYPSAGGR